MIRVLPFLFLSVLYACGGGTQSTEKTAVQPTLSEEAYIVKSFSFNCDELTIDSNFVMNTKRCSLHIDNLDQYSHLDEIRKTTDERWMELLQSENRDVARSASIWLYHLHEEKLEMLSLAMRKDSSGYFRNHQLKFWGDYFERSK